MSDPKGRHENPLKSELCSEEVGLTRKAHEEADKDIANDPDLSIHSPNDDLDEGETSRLGENVDLI